MWKCSQALRGELTNFYRCVRERPLELTEKLRFRLISQEDFIDHKNMGSQDRSEVERAARFYWYLKLAFANRASKNANFGYRLCEGPQRFRSEYVEPIITAAHERLKDVLVFNEDFEQLIKRVDRPETFCYCDPPYWGAKGCYAHEFTEADHERLAKTLRDIKGKFLLSYNDCREIRSLYKCCKIETLSTKYSIMRKVAARKKTFGELLIRNY